MSQPCLCIPVCLYRGVCSVCRWGASTPMGEALAAAHAIIAVPERAHTVAHALNNSTDLTVQKPHYEGPAKVLTPWLSAAVLQL